MQPTNLKRSHKIHSLAADLGIKATADPVRDIVRFCEKRIARFLKDFPDCKTLSQLLDISASKLGTKFEEIHSDDQLNDVRPAISKTEKNPSPVCMRNCLQKSSVSSSNGSVENHGSCPMYPSSIAA